MIEAPKPKKLTRWIYRGKSYGTKLSAFKQIAKEELLNEARTAYDWAIELLHDEEPEDPVFGYTDEQMDDAALRFWEEKFPLKPGALVRFCKNGQPRRFDYLAYKQWLTKRAYELMKEAGV